MLNAVVGPKGDASAPEALIGLDQAEDYPAEQMGWLARTSVDTVAAMIVPDGDGGFWEVHVVGRRHEVGTRPGADRIGVTAIGLAGSASPGALEGWWNG